MIKVFSGAPDEITEGDYRKYSKLFERAGFHIIFTHCEIGLSDTLEERTADEIEELDRTHPNSANEVLQRNCVYTMAGIHKDKALTEDSTPLAALLTARSKTKKATVNIPLLIAQEQEYREINLEGLVKDITFIDGETRKEVGWYNITTNILWLGDIFHLVNQAKNKVGTITDAILSMKRLGKVTTILTVGADPEFELFDDKGTFHPAVNLFPDPLRKDEVGHDGHQETGELRPPPSTSPLGLSRNLKRILRKLVNMRVMEDMRMYVGGGEMAGTGGHIHFGTKILPEELRSTLYDMVGEPLLKLQSEGREKDHQAQPNFIRDGNGVTREKEHGIEWRVLPSFIVNQEITEAVLCTVYAIVKSYKFHNWHKGTARGTSILDDFQSLPLYEAYKPYINRFYKMFWEKRKEALQQRDVFQEWGVPKLRRPYTVQVITTCNWLSKFFQPVNVEIKRPVKIEIMFQGEDIFTVNIPSEYLDELKSFAFRHYLPPIKIHNDEKEVANTGRPLIVFPKTWARLEGKNLFCQEIRTTIQNLVVRLGGE